jgi:demethylmenaquinone methyltransferase/2-methoxy-6-polyprenyl-1,4-benzoquinol methylase
MFVPIYARTIDPVLREVRLFAPLFSGMKAGERVLDVGCGTGDQVFHYTRKGLIATGIDLSPDMIAYAQRRKEKQGVDKASFQVADAAALPFADSSFDGASVSLSLHEKDRPLRDKVISEMKRVVKDDGVLIFIDFSTPLPQNAYRHLVRLLEFIAGGEHHRNSKDYFAQGGLDALLNRNRLNVEKRALLKVGIITIIKAKNK